jgi:hypothetical protein
MLEKGGPWTYDFQSLSRIKKQKDTKAWDFFLDSSAILKSER